MANADDFLVIGGSSTIFLTQALMDCRRFFCLEVVDDLDFYPISLSAILFQISFLSKMVCIKSKTVSQGFRFNAFEPTWYLYLITNNKPPWAP